MSNSIFDEMRIFISNQTIRINSSVVINNAEYVRLSNESNLIYHEIIKLLPEERRHMLGDFEHALNLMRAISDDIMYENGLKDGIQLRITLMQ